MTTAPVQAEPTAERKLRELQAAARDLVERSTAAQGVPYHITDEAVLHRVARIVLDGQPTPGND